jgi:hypothetical protein
MICSVTFPQKLLIILFKQNTPKNLTKLNNELLFKPQKFINAKLIFKLTIEVWQVYALSYKRGFG